MLFRPGYSTKQVDRDMVQLFDRFIALYEKHMELYDLFEWDDDTKRFRPIHKPDKRNKPAESGK